MELAKSLGNPIGQGLAYMNKGTISLHQGEEHDAEAHQRRVVPTELAARRWQAWTDGGFAAEKVALDETVVAGGGPVSFAWTVSEGTYLYHSANDVRTQVPMGLYGALVVSGGSDTAA